MTSKAAACMKCSSRAARVPDAVSAGMVELSFAHGAIDFAQLQPGKQVWKNDDPELTSRLRKTFEAAASAAADGR